MKTKTIAFIIGCLTLFTACENDGDMIKVGGLESSELLGDGTTDLVLSEANYSTQVLAFTWSESNLTISDTTMSLPGSIPAESLEVSATNDFKVVKTYKSLTGTFAFTGATLNALAKDLGLPVDVANPIYFRINTALGTNTDPVYSNVVAVNVTSYFIDMSFGFILNADKEKTTFTLASPNSDGIYVGFTGVTAWNNWYLLEGNGVRWGNKGVSGSEFEATSDQSTQWNFWYPGLTGCYYSTLNTNTKEWTATLIPTLTVRGSDTTEMTFVRSEVKWYASFKTKTANEVVKVRCDVAKLFNTSSRTDSAKTTKKTLGFMPGNGNNALAFEWGSQGGDFVTTGASGDYHIVFYLSDAKNWTYEIKPGKYVSVEPISKFLYLPGIDHVISGSWTFNNYLNLISEDDSTYAGAINVSSTDGYQMGLAKGDWANVYKKGATGDATSGTLAFQGGANIPAPAAGLTFIQADLKKLTYSHTAITSLGYSGLNGVWGTDPTTMNSTSAPGVFTSSVTINTTSEWGPKFYLNASWNYPYGGANGVLTYNGPAVNDDETLPLGNYDMVVNLCKNSYAFLGDKVYIAGLNDAWDFTSVVLSKTSAGVYMGTATIAKQSKDGIQIHLDSSWSRYYGGSFSSMSYKGTNITDDKSLANGTYNVTVDFINNTCSFVAAP